MISTLVDSAFKTGCLSVASESLIRQVLDVKGYKSGDLEALAKLFKAVQAGDIRREAHQNVKMPCL